VTFSDTTLIGAPPLILFTGTGQERKIFKTFLKAAASKKGGPPAIAHSGSGTISHLVGKIFARSSKIKFNMVPYRGSAPALIDLATGTVAAHFAKLASSVALLSAGKIRTLAVTSNARMGVPALRMYQFLPSWALKTSSSISGGFGSAHHHTDLCARQTSTKDLLRGLMRASPPAGKQWRVMCG
jgi:hypothetical protein